MTRTARLEGWRVLVPRGAEWGSAVAVELEREGAVPVIAPLIRTDPVDSPELRTALDRLAAGEVDWVVTTSAAVAPVLGGATLATGTRVAAVGPATAAALAAQGIPTAYHPAEEYSAIGMLADWPSSAPERILLLHSDLAAPTLGDGLRERGHTVESVVAYTTTAVPLAVEARALLRGDGPRAVLVTSGSVAQALVASGPVPPEVVIACLGPSTADAARDAGLPVHLVAPRRTVDALLHALADFAAAPTVAPAPQEEPS